MRTFDSGHERVPRCHGLWLLIGAAVVSAVPRGVAFGQIDGIDALTGRLRVGAVAAGQTELLAGSAQALAAAVGALSEGRPGGALDALMKPHGELFQDREALVRGDALMALGEASAARAAYEAALGAARVPSVAKAAVRGLIEAHTRLGHLESAERHIEALLAASPAWSERPRLLLAQARLYTETGRLDEALLLCQRVLFEHPGSRDAPSAEALVVTLTNAGGKVASPSERTRRRHLRALIEAGMLDEAASVYARLDRRDPRVRLLGARLAARKGDDARADAMLRELTGASVPDRTALEALDRLARRRLRADDNEAARALFDRLVARSRKKDRRARSAEYLAGWIPYDAGRYDEAHRRMRAYAKRHRRASNRDDALWYAGWSSYLDNNFEAAEDALSELLSSHSNSSLAPHAYYWLGRIAQKQKRTEPAKKAFLEVLDRAPLGYYGLWARHRLERLGVRVALPKPEQPPRPPASVEAALAALGANRPVTLDRSIHLLRAGLRTRALEELQRSYELLRTRELGARATTRLSELLHGLGAHHLASRIVSGMAKPEEPLPKPQDVAWSAWRYAYPQVFETQVQRAQARHDVPPEMIWAVMRTESRYQVTAESRVGAHGLMQLMPATAREIGETAPGARDHAASYREPESNIWLGTWYLGRLVERYGGQVFAAVGAYNGGPSVMDRWLRSFDGMPLDEFVERIPYRETRRYVRRVIETWAIYQHLYDGTPVQLPATIRSSVAAAAPPNKGALLTEAGGKSTKKTE